MKSTSLMCFSISEIYEEETIAMKICEVTALLEQEGTWVRRNMKQEIIFCLEMISRKWDESEYAG